MESVSIPVLAALVGGCQHPANGLRFLCPSFASWRLCALALNSHRMDSAKSIPKISQGHDRAQLDTAPETPTARSAAVPSRSVWKGHRTPRIALKRRLAGGRVAAGDSRARRVKRDLTNRRGKTTGGVMDAGAPRACGPGASDRPSAAQVDPSSIDHQISSRAIGKRPSDSAVHHHRRSGIHHDLIGGEAAGRIGDKMRTANRDHTIGRSGRCAGGHPGRSIKSFLGGRGAPVAAGGVPVIAARLPAPRLLSAPGFFASHKRTVRGEARKAPPGSLPGFKKP